MTSVRTAWLLTRGDESVYMNIVEESGASVLIIHGPGAHSVTHKFSNVSDLNAFASELELQLVAGGYHLQAVAERRSGNDRRQSTRPSGEDRRRA